MKTKRLNTKLILLAAFSATVLTGCGITVGPKAETRLIRVKAEAINSEGKSVPAVAGMITDKRPIEVAVPDKDGNVHVGKVVLEGYDFVTPEPEEVE